MAANRISVSLMLLVTTSVWLAPTVGGRPIAGTAAVKCAISRPDGFKEPGMKNAKGECCSSFYAMTASLRRPMAQRSTVHSSTKWKLSLTIQLSRAATAHPPILHRRAKSVQGGRTFCWGNA